jgi:hypothetical protein
MATSGDRKLATDNSSSDLLIAWLSDTGESHPSYLTASAYWHAEGTRLATTPEGRARTDLQAIGLLWWIASCEMSRVIAWENTLREIGGRAGLQIMRVSS